MRSPWLQRSNRLPGGSGSPISPLTPSVPGSPGIPFMPGFPIRHLGSSPGET